MRRDWTDLIGGALLIAFGVWYAMHAHDAYSFGTLRRMGPGYFPVVLGVLVATMGALVLVPAMFRRGEMPQPNWRPFFTISLAGLGFALVVEPFGMVPATIALVALAAFAETRILWLRTAILAIALAFLAVTVFSWGLGIPVPAFRWGR